MFIPVRLSDQKHCQLGNRGERGKQKQIIQRHRPDKASMEAMTQNKSHQSH